MEHNEIRKLIDKYYAGDTSLIEETRLRALLNTMEGLPEFEDEQDLFTNYEQLKDEARPPENLQDDIVKLVDDLWKASTRRRFKKTMKWAMTGAACLAIMVFSYNRWNRPVSEKALVPTQEEQEAFTTTTQVLSYVSVAINSERSKLSGLSQINKGFSTLGELNIIDKSIKQYKTEKQ